MEAIETELYCGRESRIFQVRTETGYKVRKVFSKSSPIVSSEISAHETLSALIPCIASFISKRYAPQVEMEMECCLQGSLHGYIQQQGSNHFPEADLLKMIRGMSLTVSMMHKYRYVHRALNVDNFVVTSENVVKLIDFGSAKQINEGDSWKTLSFTEEKERFTTKRIFAHDALMLGKVFLQMVTFDFSIPTAGLTKEVIVNRCSSLGYSSKVSELIEPLFFPNNPGTAAHVASQLDELSSCAHMDRFEEIAACMTDTPFRAADYQYNPSIHVCSYCGRSRSRGIKLACGCLLCEQCADNSVEEGCFYCYHCKMSLSAVSIYDESTLVSTDDYSFA